MACRICGRTSCTESFHSLEQQMEYEEAKDRVKEGIKNDILRELSKLESSDNEDEYYVKLEDVEKIIEDVCW